MKIYTQIQEKKKNDLSKKSDNELYDMLEKISGKLTISSDKANLDNFDLLTDTANELRKRSELEREKNKSK